MRLLRSLRLSLRAQFAIGLGALLLLLAALAAGSFYVLNKTASVADGVVAEVTVEMHSTTHLRSVILRAVMPPNDYLIHGDAAERDTFARLVQEVDSAIEQAMVIPFTLAEERA